MAKQIRVQVAVREYEFNARFLDEEPGENEVARAMMRQLQGDLPNRILRVSLGAYEIQLFNDGMRIFYLQAVVSDAELDAHASEQLMRWVQAGRLTLKPRARRVIKSAKTRNVYTGYAPRIKRMRATASKAISEYVHMADHADSAEVRDRYNLVALACIHDLIGTIQHVAEGIPA